MANNNNKNNGKPKDQGYVPEGASESKDALKENGGNSRRGKRGRFSENSKTNRNHLSWYVANDDLLRDAASIPWNYRVGDSLQPTRAYDQTYRTTVPGLMAFKFVPTIGEANNPKSPINVAANMTFANMRKRISGSRSYNPVDVMQYLMALNSIYMGIAWFRRLLAISNTYALRSKFMPEIVITAMGVDYTAEFIGEQPIIRSYLNRIIAKISTLGVPAIFPIFERHSYMCTNVYMDEDSPLGQYYVFNPSVLYKRVVGEDGGKLTPVHWTSSVPRPWQEFMSTLEDMVEAVYYDEDCGTISGDILNAFGNSLYYVNPVRDTDVVVPMYDEEFMEQIHNITIVPQTLFESSPSRDNHPEHLEISQIQATDDSGFTSYLVQNLQFALPAGSPAVDALGEEFYTPLLDVKHNPSPEWAMRSTRLKVGALRSNQINNEQDGDPTMLLSVSSYGTEIVTDCRVYLYDASQGNIYGNFVVPDVVSQCASENVRVPMWLANTFSMAPLMYYLDRQDDLTVVMGKLHNTTAIDEAALAQINMCAVLGEFGVDRNFKVMKSSS